MADCTTPEQVVAKLGELRRQFEQKQKWGAARHSH